VIEPATAVSSPKQQALPLRQHCARFAEPIVSRAVWQIVNTLVPFTWLSGLMAWSVLDGWNSLWSMSLALPTAGLYVRIWIIQRDGGHGSFFASRSRIPNDRLRESCNAGFPRRVDARWRYDDDRLSDVEWSPSVAIN
jgi:fatty acid desaturase